MLKTVANQGSRAICNFEVGRQVYRVSRIPARPVELPAGGPYPRVGLSVIEAVLPDMHERFKLVRILMGRATGDRDEIDQVIAGFHL